MLMPKRVKYRKQMRGRMKGKALRGAEILTGEYALQALEPGWVSARQLEAARRSIVRTMKRRGKVWIRVFPDKPIPRELLNLVWVKVKVMSNFGRRL
jgi:large subunit ribosomal protein L16